jgi:transcription elongation factor GreA
LAAHTSEMLRLWVCLCALVAAAWVTYWLLCRMSFEEESLMPEKEVVLTVAGLRKLEAELDHLKRVKRREVAERIKQAIEFGDITENSEYDDAKNEQAYIEAKIARLENILRNARIISDEDVDTDVVRLGSRVILEDFVERDRIEYTIVGPHEADPIEMKISDESPVGKALLGHKVGDMVDVVVPAGLVRYRIMGISR